MFLGTRKRHFFCNKKACCCISKQHYCLIEASLLQKRQKRRPSCLMSYRFMTVFHCSRLYLYRREMETSFFLQLHFKTHLIGMKTILYHGDIAFCMTKIGNNFQKNTFISQKKGVYPCNNSLYLYFSPYNNSHFLADEGHKQGREVIISSFKSFYTI